VIVGVSVEAKGSNEEIGSVFADLITVATWPALIPVTCTKILEPINELITKLEDVAPGMGLEEPLELPKNH
jgi:hypothetical protein